MAVEYILIIPDFIGKGKSLRERLESMSFSNSGSNTTTVGSMSGPNGGSKLKDLYLTLKLNKDSIRLYTRVTSGESIPYMKIEVNDVTPTTLKTAVLYEFRGLFVTAFQISGTHAGDKDPIMMVAFNYDEMKHSYFK